MATLRSEERDRTRATLARLAKEDLVERIPELMGRFGSSEDAEEVTFAEFVTMVFETEKEKRRAEIEKLQTSTDAPILNALDYVAVCALTTALAYPVTRFVEPKVAAWLKSRFAAASPELL